MLGMEMMLQSMGVDPQKLQSNVDTAVAHVAQINQGIAAINQRLATIEQGLSVVINHTTVTSATTLRIEDAVLKLREDAPDNSTGFADLVEQNFPEVAATMQEQIEGGLDGRRNAERGAGYINGNADNTK